MIYLGADHGGYQLKEKVKQWLTEWQLTYVDLGAQSLDLTDDYPQYAFAVAQTVAAEDDPGKTWKDRSKGILLCRSAGGMVIAANKVKGIRAAAVYDTRAALNARLHNDTNVVGLSGDWTDDARAKEILQLWLTTEFSHDERHTRRIEEIEQMENR